MIHENSLQLEIARERVALSPNSTSTLFTGHFEPKCPVVSDVTDGGVGAAIRQALCGRPGVGGEPCGHMWSATHFSTALQGRYVWSVKLCSVTICGQAARAPPS